MPPRPVGTPVKREQLVSVLEQTKGRGTCRSCGSPLTWYRTYPGDRAMPFDGDPVPRSSHNTESGEVVVTMPAEDCHFRTCPNADQHRRRR